MRRGTSVIAGPPTGMPRPGLVTVPMPGPARSSTFGCPAAPAAHSTVAVMRAPWVQSGSSPASFTTTHRLGASASIGASTGNVTRRPSGRGTSTSVGAPPVTRPMRAALAAALAHVPVVQPVRRPPLA